MMFLTEKGIHEWESKCVESVFNQWFKPTEAWFFIIYLNFISVKLSLTRRCSTILFQIRLRNMNGPCLSFVNGVIKTVFTRQKQLGNFQAGTGGVFDIVGAPDNYLNMKDFKRNGITLQHCKLSTPDSCKNKSTGKVPNANFNTNPCRTCC